MLRVRQNQTDKKQKPDPPRGMYKQFDITCYEIQSSKIFEIRPQNRLPTHTVLYWHGGAYVSNISPIHWKFIGRLVSMLDATFIVPDYPLLPQHTCRDVTAFTLLAYEETIKKVKPEDLIVMGDSAGGGLVLVTAQEAPKHGLPQPAALVMISPFLDVTMSDPELAIIDTRDPYISLSGLVAAGDMYAAELSKVDPRVSPIYGSLTGLPPMQLFVGSDELLLVDARKLKTKAEAQKIPLEYHEGAGLFHVWPILLFMSAEATKACEQIRDFAHTHWARD